MHVILQTIHYYYSYTVDSTKIILKHHFHF